MVEPGILLVDKPAGITSFFVVSRLRKILQVRKIGHAGTLDPFATGLLVLCIGRQATKLVPRLMEGDKEYLATLKLGIETDTFDIEGKIISQREVGIISGSAIDSCLTRFHGQQWQTPPSYSALKHEGKPLYYYARKGIVITKEPRQIEIKLLQRIDGASDISSDNCQLSIRILCSKGTYIRTLAADIGTYLGCGAHLIDLRRICSGRFNVNNALSWDELQGDNALEHCKNAMFSVEEACKLLQ